MTQIKDMALVFEKVIGSARQVKILYDLLKHRKYPISHTAQPTPKEHRIFVLNYPYRTWYLIKFGSSYIGSFYLLRDNSIGISLSMHEESILCDVLNFILQKYKPLKEIKSLRAPYFHLNISPENKQMILCLESIGAKKIQLTYLLNSIKIY